MATRKVTGEKYASWHLVGYAWKSPVIRSPMTDQPMRAIVGESRSEELHAGVRIGPFPDSFGKERKQTSIFRPEGTQDLGQAIYDARAMLREKLVDHARQYAEYMQQPGEIADVVVDSRSLAIAEGRAESPAAKYGKSPSLASAAIEHGRKLKL
jgi:hypothetical protein